MAEPSAERFPSDHDLRVAIDAARRKLADGTANPDAEFSSRAIYQLTGPDGVTRTRIAPRIMNEALREAGRTPR